jgi:hypothetical protein
MLTWGFNSKPFPDAVQYDKLCVTRVELRMPLGTGGSGGEIQFQCQNVQGTIDRLVTVVLEPGDIEQMGDQKLGDWIWGILKKKGWTPDSAVVADRPKPTAPVTPPPPTGFPTLG